MLQIWFHSSLQATFSSLSLSSSSIFSSPLPYSGPRQPSDAFPHTQVRTVSLDGCSFPLPGILLLTSQPRVSPPRPLILWAQAHCLFSHKAFPRYRQLKRVYPSTLLSQHFNHILSHLTICFISLFIRVYRFPTRLWHLRGQWVAYSFL